MGVEQQEFGEDDDEISADRGEERKKESMYHYVLGKTPRIVHTTKQFYSKFYLSENVQVS